MRSLLIFRIIAKLTSSNLKKNKKQCQVYMDYMDIFFIYQKENSRKSRGFLRLYKKCTYEIIKNRSEVLLLQRNNKSKSWAGSSG